MVMRLAVIAAFLIGFSLKAGFSAEVAGSSSTARIQSEEFLNDSALKSAAGEFKQALIFADQAIDSDPSNARAYLQRAGVELKTKNYADADKDALKAMDLGYRKTSAFNTRSAALTGLGRFKEAFAHADTAVKLNPDGPTGFLNRATAREGLHAAAVDILADYERAADLDKRWKTVFADAQKRYAPPPVKITAAPLKALEPQARVQPTPPPAGAAAVWSAWRAVALGSALVVLLLVLFIRALRRHQTRRVRFGSVMKVPMPSLDEPRVGAVVGGRYILGKVLEREGSADVIDARDLEDRPRTLKRLPRRDAAFLQRAQAAAGLKHPAVFEMEAVFEQGGHVYLAYVAPSGEPLRRVLERVAERRLSPESALRIIQSVCGALDFSHSRGVFHGHLTPSYIIVDKSGARVKGFALPAEASEFDYLAPEQDAGLPTVESDVFCLGVCLYEMLTGQRPFKGPESGQAKREGSFPAASGKVKSLSAGIDDLLVRAMAPDPARRFHAAGELFGALRNLVVPGVH
jgi:tetratricopeptide (TPR) repeat protein